MRHIVNSPFLLYNQIVSYLELHCNSKVLLQPQVLLKIPRPNIRTPIRAKPESLSPLENLLLPLIRGMRPRASAWYGSVDEFLDHYDAVEVDDTVEIAKVVGL
jgi:hypothetical protein